MHISASRDKYISSTHLQSAQLEATNHALASQLRETIDQKLVQENEMQAVSSRYTQLSSQRRIDENHISELMANNAGLKRDLRALQAQIEHHDRESLQSTQMQLAHLTQSFEAKLSAAPQSSKTIQERLDASERLNAELQQQISHMEFIVVEQKSQLDLSKLKSEAQSTQLTALEKDRLDMQSAHHSILLEMETLRSAAITSEDRIQRLTVELANNQLLLQSTQLKLDQMSTETQMLSEHVQKMENHEAKQSQSLLALEKAITEKDAIVKGFQEQTLNHHKIDSANLFQISQLHAQIAELNQEIGRITEENLVLAARAKDLEQKRLEDSQINTSVCMLGVCRKCQLTEFVAGSNRRQQA